MPMDLKYLAVAESSLLPQIRSAAGAVGIWQFMPETAVRKGLKKNVEIDERRHFELSTLAAITYLKQLKQRFGKWSLALAGYNCGEERVEKEMREQQVDDYYRLTLPTETERFVFRIAAVKLILENHEKYGYYILPEDLYPPILIDSETVSLSTPIHLTALAKALDTDLKTLKELNAHINGYYLPKGSYPVKLPHGKAAAFHREIARLENIARQQNIRYYTVQAGDTLSEISRKTGVSVDLIKRLNHLKDSIIHAGQSLHLDLPQ
jgi:hypothetical protein